MIELFDVFVSRFDEVVLRTGEHILLTGISTLFAVLIGVPLGIFCYRRKAFRSWVMGLVGILQTIPSLAMLAILLAAMGRIGTAPAVVALFFYALLPIVRNTLAGLEGVGSDVKEAARGMGLSPNQCLRWVELPLAEPVILAGIRTASVVGVGIATLSAFIGAGGLGQFINRGLALSNTTLILLGAVPSALLALAVDFSIAGFAWAREPKPTSKRRRYHLVLGPLLMALPFFMILLGVAGYLAGGGFSLSPYQGGSPQTIRIGSKNFTEQIVLGEIMALSIEEGTSLRVERKFNLGGTLICHQALENGEIDIYAEYTGTALTAILGLDVASDPEEVLERVRSGYRRKFRCEWLDPFGFDNTYAITVRREMSESQGWEKISDIQASAGDLRAGFTSEFAERPDGYPGFKKAYQIEFGETRDLDPSILYQAIEKEEVDLICAFATDGRIAAYDLYPLDDDLEYFPPYQAAPVIRIPVLDQYPEVVRSLSRLAGKIDSDTMRRLNYEVDEMKRAPREVAREFLIEVGVLSARIVAIQKDEGKMR